jgi:hypothetical protein
MDESKLTELERVIRSGSDLETACHYAELSIAVVYTLLEQGKVETERRLNTGAIDKSLDAAVSLWELLKKARADAIVRNVTIVQKAAQNGNWNAAKWWLENHLPEVYGRKDKDDKKPKAIE